MLNDSMKYKFIKQSESELASDEIVKNLSRKLWNDSGYTVAYYLGMVNCLSGMAKSVGVNAYSKLSLIEFIASIKEINEAPDEIKALIDIVLKELQEN